MSGYRGRGYRRNCHCDHNGGDGELLGCLVIVFLIICAMPLVGLYLLVAGEDDESRILGGFLLIVGLIIFLAIGLS